MMLAVGFLRVPVPHTFLGKSIINSRETVFMYSFAGGGVTQGWRKRRRGRGERASEGEHGLIPFAFKEKRLCSLNIGVVRCAFFFLKNKK